MINWLLNYIYDQLISKLHLLSIYFSFMIKFDQLKWMKTYLFIINWLWNDTSSWNINPTNRNIDPIGLIMSD